MKTLVMSVIVLFFINTSYAQSPQEYTEFLNTSGIFQYDVDSYQLKPVIYPLLDKLAFFIYDNKNYKLNIDGHTDNEGSFDYNLQLSLSRAQEIKNYLVFLQCPADRIIINAFGFAKPVTDNLSPDSRSKNRRIEFSWVTDDNYSSTSSGNFKVNSSIIPLSGKELNMDLAVIEKDSNVYQELKEEDIKADLSWYYEDKEFSTGSTIRLIPINHEKKISASLILDYSNEMYDNTKDIIPKPTEKISVMENAARLFIDNCNNRVFAKLVKFGGDYDEVVDYTGNLELIKNNIGTKSYLRPDVAMLRTIYYEVRDNQYRYNPAVMKTILVFSGSKDNLSRHISVDKIVNTAVGLGIRIYAFGMFDKSQHSDPPGKINDGERDLYNIAMQTGGEYFYFPDKAAFNSIYRNILRTVFNSYTISIIWNSDQLPPKGTMVKAVVKIKIKNETKTFIKDYLMP